MSSGVNSCGFRLPLEIGAGVGSPGASDCVFVGSLEEESGREGDGTSPFSSLVILASLGVWVMGLRGASLLAESSDVVLRERDDRWWGWEERIEGSGAPVAEDSTSPSYVGESIPSLSSVERDPP